MALLALFLVSAALLAPPVRAAEDPRKREPTSWDVRLSPPGEPGELFEMSGALRSPTGDALPKPGSFMHTVHRDKDGVWRLKVDFAPQSSASAVPVRVERPELRYPPLVPADSAR